MCYPWETSSAGLLQQWLSKESFIRSDQSLWVFCSDAYFILRSDSAGIYQPHCLLTPETYSLEAAGFNQLYRGMCSLTCSAWRRIIKMCYPHNFCWLIVVNLSFFPMIVLRNCQSTTFENSTLKKPQKIKENAKFWQRFLCPQHSSLICLNFQ